MTVANDGMGYENPVLQTFLAHGTIPTDFEEDRFSAFQGLEAKYESDCHYIPWDLEYRPRSAR